MKTSFLTAFLVSREYSQNFIRSFSEKISFFSEKKKAKRIIFKKKNPPRKKWSCLYKKDEFGNDFKFISILKIARN